MCVIYITYTQHTLCGCISLTNTFQAACIPEAIDSLAACPEPIASQRKIVYDIQRACDACGGMSDLKRKQASTSVVASLAGRRTIKGRRVKTRASAKRMGLGKVSKIQNKYCSRVSKRIARRSVRRAKTAAEDEAADQFLASLARELAI